MHFADADSSPEYTHMQLERFHQVLRRLEGRGDRLFHPPLLC